MKLFKFFFTTTFITIILQCANSKEWWENANYYQIYPRSFMDSNGDGVGDLKGIESKIGYLKDLGMDGVWLSPIMSSPMVDHGYDISDFHNIDPIFGSLNDFDDLLAECKKQGIHLILDFVPNHTSNKHDWFIKSERRDPGYEDFYIWHDGISNPEDPDRPLPPNNWISVFRYSAWQWSDIRKQFYYHAFVKEQPDLNYRNPKVVEEMKNVLRFWLNKGVSGFRVDAVPHLFEIAPDSNGNLPDEPLSGTCDDKESYCYHLHIHTTNLPETLEMVYEWRKVLDEYKNDTRIMMTEAYTDLDLLMKYYTDGKRNGSHVPFGFEVISKLTAQSTAKQVQIISENYQNHIPNGFAPNWVLGNHDQKRLASRLGETRLDLYNIFLQTMPGMAITYQGEEIGMTDVVISWSDTQDPQACNTSPQVYHNFSRDPARTPFQWNAQMHAGFSNALRTWLPVGTNYRTLNVEAQEKASKSHLKLFKTLTHLRKKPAFQSGFYESANHVDEQVFAFLRSDNFETYVIVLNFDRVSKSLNLTNYFRDLAKHGDVVAASINANWDSGSHVHIDDLNIPGEAGVIVKLEANDHSGSYSSKPFMSLVTLFYVLAVLHLFS